MLEYIKKNFELQSTKIIGSDNKYHTVYYILFETGNYYIGKHSSLNIENDEYFCSGKAAKILKEKGILYTRQIISYLNSAEEAICLETSLLSDKKIYEHKNCLNCYPGSPPDLSNSIIISIGNKFKMINSKLLEYYLQNGWKKCGIKRIWVTDKDNKNVKYILDTELEKYLKDGWHTGSIKARNRTFIKKGNMQKFILNIFIDQYINDGWNIHHPHEGKIVIEKNRKRKFIYKEYLNDYLNEGWFRSSTISGLKYIVKDKQLKRIPKEELEKYLNNGWKIGNNKSNQIYINNGIVEKRIYREEIDKYESYSVGRLKYIYLTDGINNRRLYVNIDREEIEKLLNEQWKRGITSKNK